MQKISPFLWFDTQAEDAAKFYVSIFSAKGGSASGRKNSKITNVTRYGKEGFDVHHMPEGTAMTVNFELDGQEFTALNGGPLFKFTEAVSFSVSCDSQEEVDMYWEKLIADGGEESQCGWLKDKFGLSWQIVPKRLGELMGDKDAEKAGRVMNAMLQMKKIIIADLEKASNQE